MNRYQNTDKDIHKLIYLFVLGCFRDVVKKIPKTTENISIIGQIASSLTSMGANDREADACGSQRDFIAKYMIVRKETNETHYWLSLIHDLLLVELICVESYQKESIEILRIVSSIVSNAKHNSL